MVAFKRMAWFSVAGALASLAILLAGCGGRYDVNEILRQLVEERGLGGGDDTVTVRIANQTVGVDEVITLRIDGLEEVFSCPAEEMVCNYPLGTIPQQIDVVEEQRYDEDGGFVGGRILDGQPGFTITREQYSAGSIILLLFGSDIADVRVF